MDLLPPKRSEVLRAHLAALDAWTNSDAFIGWKAARLDEARRFLAECGTHARDWTEVIELRARASETISITENSFEDARQTLEEEIARVSDEETQLAATASV